MFRRITKIVTPCLVAAAVMLGAPAFAAQPHAPAHEGMLDAALHDVELRSDQRKAVEALATDERAARAPLREAATSLRSALADEVKSNTVDAGTLAPKVTAVADAASRARATEDGEIDKLHALLDSQQRAALADKMEASAAKSGSAKSHELRRLSKQLGLSPEQRKQIAAILKEERAEQGNEHTQAKAKEKGVLDAFKGQTFSMEKFRPAADARANTLRTENERIAVVKKIDGVLTPDQRAKLAGLVAKGGRV
jgi:Spy/CpxP family protein refolding chaperone